MKDFDKLFKKGKSSGNKFLIVKVVKTKPEDPLRIAFVVSNKTEKSAVKRNRAKRQAREIVHKLLPKLKSELDAAVTIKKAFLPLEFKDKEKAVEDVLAKAGLI